MMLILLGPKEHIQCLQVANQVGPEKQGMPMARKTISSKVLSLIHQEIRLNRVLGRV